ncbi:MAG: SAM-dependent chlorinase/fluorinase [Chloroflexi bacterium]|nr:SAM-dependent chlorinase/fluorinase [Chloroflexota bacterium]
MPAIVTLTTDFGTRDPYAAQLKGVLLANCEGVRVHDLTHEVAPQEVLEGALFLAAAVPTFPPGTVHLAVVDPGVGTSRRAIAASLGGQHVVCPDNGLLTLLARRAPIEEVRSLERSSLRREPVSPTFHGRDLFAPAAAFLACGGALEQLGPPVADPIELPLSRPRSEGARLLGEVLHVDRFGNAITNLARSDIEAIAAGPGRVEAGGRRLALARTYGDVAEGEPLALIGSADLLELAVRNGSAAATLGLDRGSEVVFAAG